MNTIKPQELKTSDFRIGNYINHCGRLSKITALSRAIHFENEVESVFEFVNEGHGFEPIKLTEEILLRCGFEHNGIGSFEKKYSRYEDEKISFIAIYYDVNQQRWVVWVGNDNTPTGVAVNSFEYLHQLQNLFYFLCGEELTLKDHA